MVKEDKVTKPDQEWKKLLSSEEYLICRKKGTEPPFTGKYWDSKEKGVYRCVCCGAELFNSKTKFDSGTGWPSFWEPLDKENVREEHDTSYGMQKQTFQNCAGS